MKFEYCGIVLIDGKFLAMFTSHYGSSRMLGEDENIVQLLNKLGNNGWELVSPMPSDVNGYIMKRVIEK
jgi:hypothetical protein